VNTGRLPVVAAIPNYNMGENLRRLLPQVLAQRYDAVFVLDDASTDDSADVVRGFGDDVRFVRSDTNRGAGANRNQIIDQVPDGVLIHFIDADMEKHGIRPGSSDDGEWIADFRRRLKEP
jgi:N-acetylglucosaminyl-diphospho-decaprenol L-rhamnosyltransferase